MISQNLSARQWYSFVPNLQQIRFFLIWIFYSTKTIVFGCKNNGGYKKKLITLFFFFLLRGGRRSISLATSVLLLIGYLMIFASISVWCSSIKKTFLSNRHFTFKFLLWYSGFLIFYESPREPIFLTFIVVPISRVVEPLSYLYDMCIRYEAFYSSVALHHRWNVSVPSVRVKTSAPMDGVSGRHLLDFTTIYKNNKIGTWDILDPVPKSEPHILLQYHMHTSSVTHKVLKQQKEQWQLLEATCWLCCLSNKSSLTVGRINLNTSKLPIFYWGRNFASLGYNDGHSKSLESTNIKEKTVCLIMQQFSFFFST